MARYEHLQLLRLPERFERRKTGGGGRTPARDPGAHSGRLRTELDQAVAAQQQRRRPEFVNPALILRVQMTGALLEEDWNRLGLTVLSSDDDRTLVLFASSDDMTAFRERLAAYARGVPPGQQNPSYAAFIGGIEAIAAVSPRDRIGIRAREDGLTDATDFQPGTAYTVDVELWDVGRRELRIRKIEEIAAYVDARGGEELDRYVGPSISLVRVRCDGSLIQTLLAIDEVAEIDLLPVLDTVTADAIDLPLGDLPAPEAVPEDAPLIGIIDSGVNDHPLIADILAGSIAVPDTLGTADDHGHGTFVGGIAAFGDLRGQLAAGTLARGARLCSAKVLDHTGNFPDSRLTPRQMREAITRLNQELGCRIFVIALGDRKRVFDGGKVGPWSATLDELARELDVLIIVAAGNRPPRTGNRIEQAVTDYPVYLLEPANRLCEPAGAMNVVTVGSLAHGDGLGSRAAGNVGVRAITGALEPSPFSRAGPGLRGGIKPDVVDVGGTLIYDPIVARLRGGEDVPEAGVISLNNRFVDRLFATRSGTSFSAPLVAFKAAQILRHFPDASANRLRALLAGSASVPAEARAKLRLLDAQAEKAICGHGVVDAERATFSDDARVVLYAEDELEVDHFAIYQIPVPEPFQRERGRRTIRVALAYDPPVRHSRRDYNGVSMSFRLIRGCNPDHIFDHFRRRAPEEDRFPEMADRFNCKLDPSPTLREKASLQTATVQFSRDVSHYGDTYYLVVRCAGGWASDIARQAFAVVVEIAHEAEVALYERMRARVRVGT